MKCCETCGVRLQRRTCSRRCAGQIPKAVKIEDPRGWYEVADWLREKGAMDVHGPVRILSRDEITALQGIYS